MSTNGKILSHSAENRKTKFKITNKEIVPSSDGTISHESNPIIDKKSVNNSLKKATLGYISHEETIDMVESTENEDPKTTVYKNKEAPHVVHNKLLKQQKNIETPKKLYQPKIQKFEKFSEKTVNSLDNNFKNDVGLILTDILEQKTNFEEYPIRYKIRGFDIIEGEEGFAEKTQIHPFTLRTPIPKAIAYMVSTLLTRSHNMGYDSHKILDMLIDTLKNAASIEDWLHLLKNLWIELIKQRKI